MRYVAVALFLLCVPVANWMIHNIGTVCIPDGPCLIPVAPGIMSPSGVLVIGAALVLRDVVHRALGLRWVIGCILAGGILSYAVAPAALVMASVAAFLLSEGADLAVYTPLQKRGFIRAVVASSAVGLVIDSGVFLWLAFGSFVHIDGQIIGKAWMVLLSIPIIHAVRRHAARPA